MLYLYQSDQLESLCELLAAVVAQPQSSVLAEEIVIVQSKGMGRWITLQLAQRHGICANMQFPLPASFIWQLARQVVGNLPEHSPFAPELMSWRLYTALPRVAEMPEGALIQRYLEADNPARAWRLAWRVADIFDQYLVYRPEWIAAWERGERCDLGPHEDWQAALWVAMSTGRSEPHRAEVIHTLLTRLKEDDSLTGLPERVVLFAVSSLPPVMMELIEVLSARMDVCLFALNPCEAEWGQITDQREMLRLSRHADLDDDLFLEIGNPLLASLGKQGRDFFDEIHARFPELVSLFEEPESTPESVLEVLQRDILELVDREQCEPYVLDQPDRSLQIHSCHSPMRELEVLHDQLLALFDAKPGLQPDEVVVLLPAIGDYAPYIDAVFAKRDGEPSIPYTIADRGLADLHPMLEIFETLLSLPESRFEAEWVMGLLDHPAVLRRFELTAEDLMQIRRWIRDAGIRWGRDAKHKGQLGLPEDAMHTWQHGFQRLLLGYALPQVVAQDMPPLFAGMLPSDDVEGGRALVLGQFHAFYKKLAYWADELAEPASPGQWNARLNGLLADFFAPDMEEEELLVQLRTRLELLLRVEDTGYCDQPVASVVIASWLRDLLKQPGGAGGFLSGGVTFCTLVPMRSLPFRAICLLGLNDGAFPRGEGPAGFDLISQHPRRGDRSRRFDDRYLFLETLLSARDTLYISYVGQDIRDNSERPPSVLVAELMDVARRSVSFKRETSGSDWLLTTHPLQPFDARYFQGMAEYPGYSRQWCSGAKALQEEPSTEDLLLSNPLALNSDIEVDVEDFLRFFTNPARYFLRERLGIRIDMGEEMLSEEELFTLDDQFLLRQALHEHLLEPHTHSWTQQQRQQFLGASGSLPPGQVGRAISTEIEEAVTAVLPRCASALESPELPPVPVEIELEGMRLSGWLRGVTEIGLFEVDARNKESSAGRQLGLWLRHLMLCHIRPDGVELNSEIIALDTGTKFSAVDNAADILGNYLKAYVAGQQQVIPFFPKTSLAYAESWRKDEDQQKAVKAAYSKWHGSGFNGNFYPESDNPYYQLFYRGLDPLSNPEFAKLTLSLMMPLLDARSKPQ